MFGLEMVRTLPALCLSSNTPAMLSNAPRPLVVIFFFCTTKNSVNDVELILDLQKVKHISVFSAISRPSSVVRLRGLMAYRQNVLL
jgi:hypothetical protein